MTGIFASVLPKSVKGLNILIILVSKPALVAPGGPPEATSSKPKPLAMNPNNLDDLIAFTKSTPNNFKPAMTVPGPVIAPLRFSFVASIKSSVLL